jgi:hypothetical protein
MYHLYISRMSQLDSRMITSNHRVSTGNITVIAMLCDMTASDNDEGGVAVPSSTQTIIAHAGTK